VSTLASFEFATATRIVFGAGKLSEVPALLSELGAQRILFVTGRDPTRGSALETKLRSSATGLLTLRAVGEPSVDWIRESLVKVREVSPEAVVAFGGGSVIDAAKALAALAANGGDPLDYLEVIGRGQTLTKPSLPLIAIPTTAGTGAEVTRNAVLGSTQGQLAQPADVAASCADRPGLARRHAARRLAIERPRRAFAVDRAVLVDSRKPDQ
jgi:alcohol dehydrogenase class IV